ncbi:IclR family transcriptional regulator [Jannaschia aquimarina]|uniref:KdgR protein n=1 Tax=Jannaschia aquimarina TaxID=935700 RepID=A0A0D1EF00_9RHOB|nr:IclR family transcriptional regulator [Jannaschia aquimarina]KIT14485.1 Transcriptional regulator KdgR [Jannaschia aquimarina]SNT28704.1 transcriptional regulator, IclR family [Jannaschia aquimarina]
MNVENRQSGDGTVGKALAVLDAVAAAGRPVRFAALLEDSPYPKATLYRLLQTLVSQGMLDLDPDRGTYSPGLRLVRMAHSAWAQSSLAPIARPHLDALSADVGETVHLAQLDGGAVLYVDKRNAARPVQMYSEAGKVGPAYCTGVGKAMLAFLPEPELEAALARQSWHRFTGTTITDPDAMRVELATIRTEGVARDRQEHEPGIACIAAPVLGPGGRVQGAVSITGPTDRIPAAALEAHIPRLRRAADDITRDLRDWRFPDEREERHDWRHA